ncbi:hypothetical protein [Nocardioides panacisoli]|uniref:Poly(3-hydroxybutyrate) depolymerase n=1 Tax=Nocardioides panacisoli TaxID=627624 RepID=A0ABP7IPI1_9ACTN
MSDRPGAQRRRTTAAGLLAVILGAAALSAASPAPEAAARAGDVCGTGPATGSSQITTTDGAVHKYYWRVPSTAAPAAGRPVLIWLHGDGGTGAAMAPGFWPYADPDGAMIITPNGTDGTWNHMAGDVPGTPYDAQFLSKIIDTVDACGSVDSSKVFVGGTSRGAFMPYYLLQRASTRDRIAAVAVNAGLVYCQDQDPECDLDHPASGRFDSSARIIHLHGTNDTQVSPPPTATFHDPVDWDVDWRVFFPMDLWAQNNGCWDPNEVGGTNNGVLKETYDVAGNQAKVYDLTGNGPSCADYQLILVDHGGHVIDGQEGRIWAFLMDRPFSQPSNATCDGQPATITGTSGDDTLVGTSGPDVIAGLAGGDVIKGLGGDDHLCGGTGNDRIIGGGGADVLLGQGWWDQLVAKDGQADRRINCGGGEDPKATRDASDPKPVSCG